MTVLSRGANAPLAAGVVDVAVSGASQGSVDLMVFQLTADRKVRSDADFVFFNQPMSPEGAVRLVARRRVSADLNAIPPVIETLAIAVALDDGVPGSLAAIPGLGVTVTSGEQHRADASGLTVERAAVLVEIYRRAGVWKVRNVSAGWAAGLSALAAEHGVSVDESPAQPPPAPAQPPPAPPPPPPPARPAPPAPEPSLPPVSLPPVALPQAVPQYQPVPQYQSQQYPAPGGFPPPGGDLPPSPPIIAPRPGGWDAPGSNWTS